MQFRDLAVAIAALISVVFLTTGADAASYPQHITDPKQNYTITGNDVMLHSLVGDIKIPMPDYVKAELRERSLKIKKRRVARQAWFGRNAFSRHNLGWGFGDFFECSEQAQIALSPYTENHRYWEAFFKRNSVNNTIAVRYCCNLLEYIDNAEMHLTDDCRSQVRLQEQVMTKPEIRYVCREYEFYNVQCFLVRWMYFWIPFVLLLLIGFGIFFGCAALRKRRNKSQLNEDHKSLKEQKYDDNSNTLPYRPAYTSPQMMYTSPLKSSATNKAFMHN